MCRETESGYRIGPWVCNPENTQVARELLMKCMKKIRQNGKLYVGVPAVNKAAVEILQDFNFKQYSKSIRMYFGKKLETERVDGIFAIGGPEKGQIRLQILLPYVQTLYSQYVRSSRFEGAFFLFQSAFCALSIQRFRCLQNCSLLRLQLFLQLDLLLD